MLEWSGVLGKTWLMRIRVVVAGKPALGYAKLAVEDYLRRLSRYGSYELTHVKAGGSGEVSQRLLEATEGCWRVALDERGEGLTTRELAHRMEGLEADGGVKRVAFLIGAADGHDPVLRECCDLVLGLSRLTMQHELALVVLLEQLYRLASLKAGSPYHRE